MGKDYNDVLRYLSFKIRDLIKEINEYSKEALDDDLLKELKMSNLDVIFESDSDIKGKIEVLLSTVNIVINLECEFENERQKLYSAYMVDVMKNEDECLDGVNSCFMCYDDFKPVGLV